MSKKWIFVTAAAILLAAVVLTAVYLFRASNRSDSDTDQPHPSEITNFEQCIDAGYPVQESDPRRCTLPDGTTFTEEIESQTEDDNNTGIANPASVYCEDQGGALEIRETTDGQTGICVFDDGSECEEWAYYRGECAPGESK